MKKRKYKLLRGIKRDRYYFTNEEYQDWDYYKDNPEHEEVLSEGNILESYKRYQPARRNAVDYLRTVLEILDDGKNLSILTRDDLINFIVELFHIYRWIVYLPKKPQNRGISILVEKKFNSIGFTRCIFLVRIKSLKRKIGIGVTRELDYHIKNENASKGAIVTTGSLTRGALKVITEKSRIMFHLDNEILEKKVRVLEKVYK